MYTLAFFVCEGFAAVYLTKERNGAPHLSTPHSMAGAATLGYLLMQLCAGLNLLFPQLVVKFVSLRQLGRMHGLSGSLLLLLATLTMLGGLMTPWFQGRVAAAVVWYVCLACPPAIYSFIAAQVLLRNSARQASDKNKQS